jgi:hypothetical protein
MTREGTKTPPGTELPKVMIVSLQSSSGVSICTCIRRHSSAYVGIRRYTSAYVSIRQHTSTYVSTELPKVMIVSLELLRCQYLYVCTSKASKLYQILMTAESTRKKRISLPCSACCVSICTLVPVKQVNRVLAYILVIAKGLVVDYLEVIYY